MSNHVFFYNHSIHLAQHAAYAAWYSMCEQPGGNQSGQTWSADPGDAAL